MKTQLFNSDFMAEKIDARRKLPMIAKLIGIFYILFALFYLLLGIVFSGIILGFSSLMSVSLAPFSETVVKNGLAAVSYLTKDFFPVLSIFYPASYVSIIGLLAFTFGIIVSLVCIGFFKKRGWARFAIIGLSLFEFVVVGTIYFVRGGFLSVSAHWTMHGFIILYLLLSKKTRIVFSGR